MTENNIYTTFNTPNLMNETFKTKLSTKLSTVYQIIFYT